MGNGTDDKAPTRPGAAEKKTEPEGPPPLVSVKTVGAAARKFDELLTKAIGAGVGGGFKLVSDKLKRSLHSGYWQNYAFVIFAALIFAAAVLVLIMRFWR